MTKLIANKVFQLRSLLFLASLLLMAGFVMPMLTITQFFLFDHSISIISGLWQLVQDGQIILFILIATFSIIVPISKIVLLFLLLSPATVHGNRSKKLLHLMHDYGRWAMLDVLIVAILIVTVKLGFIATIQIHSGLYIFASAVLLIMFITHHVVKQLD